ncbi:MAG: hypothetical protein ABII82_09075, partial [Verrucomicrobiota bacterium]
GRWPTREVLPAIRKDGAYVMGEEKVRTGEMSEDQLVLRALEILQERCAIVTLQHNLRALRDLCERVGRRSLPPSFSGAILWFHLPAPQPAIPAGPSISQQVVADHHV